MQASLLHSIKPKPGYVGKDKHEKDNCFKNHDILMNDQESNIHVYLNELNIMCKEKKSIKDEKRKLKVIENDKVKAEEEERKDDSLRATKKQQQRDNGKLEMKKSRSTMD